MTDGRKGRKIPTKEVACEVCGNIFVGGPKAKYCKEHKTYAEFLKKMENHKWRLGKLLASAKNRSKTKKLKFNIDIEYVLELWEENLGCCALTGQPFDLTSWGEKGQVNPQAPSIDRIIPKKGYTKGNIRLITYHMNISLSDFGTEEFERLAKAYLGGV